MKAQIYKINLKLSIFPTFKKVQNIAKLVFYLQKGVKILIKVSTLLQKIIF